ncbi:PREDICTED: uncharacterized protein LOC109589665 [Amphimedon queenslandica]|uniref:Uncharacterized protein n=1 Tax=Amphimedon queenslandica TaxID=400682 RepID=A0AAN0JWI1_AMPQE|nr:PREDICTED: uncharacterized protein LOC109589665 [Amphimedon queenslandica]|eukprot:XP_019861278.1 PREDICTED: uncharacterized protein LOC109589665 [Amphimedon queenslandica]
MFSYVRDFPDQNSVSTLKYKHFIKIVGYTLLNNEHSTAEAYKYTRSWQRAVTLFRVNFRFFIILTTLDITFSGHLSGQMKFNAFIARFDNNVNMKASAMLETGPTLTVRGEASIRFFGKLGMEVSASITYLIDPKASTTLCGSSSQDASTCFEVYGTTKGNIAVEAYRQSRKKSCKQWFKCKKSWGRKKIYHKLSRTWSLVNRRKKLFGLCYTCNCYGRHFLNVLCKGSQYGASRCSCSIKSSK